MRLACVSLLLIACNNDTSVNSSTGAQACATATACGIVAGGVSNCTANALNTNNPLFASTYHISAKMVNCIAMAGADCAAAKKCLNGGDTPAACTGNSMSCTGTVLNGCAANAGTGNNNGTTKFDCGDVAQMCVVNNGAADCGVGSCAGPQSMCVGTKIQTCGNGILKQYDCADFGDTCVVGALNIAHCRGTGAACQTQGFAPLGNAIRCDGTVLVRCADSQESRFDCASQNQQCVPNVNGESFGCALGSSCNPATFSATCSGLKMTFCNDGVISTFDCGSAGFKSCSPNNGGTCGTT
jgi:hypothetical protein